MRRVICSWIKNPCCGWQGWLYRVLGCSEFEPQPEPQLVTVTVCDSSDKLAHIACPIVYPKSFMIGKAPTEYCRKHKRLKKYGKGRK